MFEARHLSKRYGARLAVADVSVHVRRGEILGYLGPNGSGKSTTIKMIVGLLEPDAGWIGIDDASAGDDPIGFKRRLGYVPEELQLYTHLSAREYLRLIGRLRGLPATLLERKIETFTDLLALDTARDQLMLEYSKGMRQRVLLAAALMHDPELLILDEPFSGLDVHGASLLMTLLRALADAGKMILFSSHRLDVVERICGRVVILNAGRVVGDLATASLRAESARLLEDVFAELTAPDDHDGVVRDLVGAMRMPR